MDSRAAGKGILRNHLSRLVTWTRTQASMNGRRRRLVLGLSALAIGFVLLVAVADRLWAAIELAYYRGAATNSAVFLEWATVREVNVNGFEILCKPEDAPDTVYHPIGSRIALGSPTSGATYNFDVTSGLVPGERYCFRLREITGDDTPGEAFDLCGYGLGITPPPTSAATVVVSIPVTLTPTVIPVQVIPGLTPPPTLIPTVDPFLTLTPALDPFLTLTPQTPPFDPFAPTPTNTTDPQFVSPLTPPDQSLQQQQAPFDPNAQFPQPTPNLGQDPNALQIPPTPTETVTLTPTPFGSETPTPSPSPSPTNTETPTVTPTGTITPAQASNAVVVIDPATSDLPVLPDSSAALGMVEAPPPPLYVVVTATPTPLPQGVAVLPPTLTPWPTVVPTVAFSFNNLLVPNTQNLMVGLLCLIFLSASGLGALGLVTSVLYMRSQSRRERLPGPVYERRRY